MLKIVDITLPKDYKEKDNMFLVAQAIRVYEDRGHVGLRKAKTRAEVNRTKKKVYKQKGTGGARHGARSAPIFVGGGVAHGPRPVSRTLTLSQALRRKALNIVISMKAREKEILFVDGLGTVKKTKEISDFMKKNKIDKKALFVLSKENKGAQQFLRNMDNAVYALYENMNAYQVFKTNKLIFDATIFPKEKTAK